eukprot:scaffold84493_cov63-Phaeocystis_antarctica.AAC.7
MMSNATTPMIASRACCNVSSLVSGGAAACRAATCSFCDRATHSAASSAVAKLPRHSFLPTRHNSAWKGLGLPGL